MRRENVHDVWMICSLFETGSTERRLLFQRCKLNSRSAAIKFPERSEKVPCNSFFVCSSAFFRPGVQVAECIEPYLCTASDSRPWTRGGRTATRCRHQARRPSAMPLRHSLGWFHVIQQHQQNVLSSLNSRDSNYRSVMDELLYQHARDQTWCLEWSCQAMSAPTVCSVQRLRKLGGYLKNKENVGIKIIPELARVRSSEMEIIVCLPSRSDADWSANQTGRRFASCGACSTVTMRMATRAVKSWWVSSCELWRNLHQAMYGGSCWAERPACSTHWQ